MDERDLSIIAQVSIKSAARYFQGTANATSGDVLEAAAMFEEWIKDAGTRGAVGSPQTAAPAASPPAPVAGVPQTCPKCGQGVWDNRPKKATGEYKPTSPDFKCKDKSCGWVQWPEKASA